MLTIAKALPVRLLYRLYPAAGEILAQQHAEHRRLGRIFKTHFRLLQSAAAGPCIDEQAHVFAAANGEDDLIAPGCWTLSILAPMIFGRSSAIIPDNSIASSAMVPLHANRVQLVYPLRFSLKIQPAEQRLKPGGGVILRNVGLMRHGIYLCVAAAFVDIHFVFVKQWQKPFGSLGLSRGVDYRDRFLCSSVTFLFPSAHSMVRVKSSYTPSPMCARPSMLMLFISLFSIRGQK